MGFILGAKGARKAIFLSELASALLQVALAWICVKYFGLNGTGMAFFASYICYGFLIYFIVRSVSGFRWSSENKRIGAIFFALITMVFIGWYSSVPRVSFVIGSMIITLFACYFSAKKMCALIPVDRLPKPVRLFAVLLKIVPRGGQ